MVDIGSNDGTTLGFYPATLRRVGVDPTGEKFRAHYQKGVELISDFFSGEILLAYTSSKKAKVVTSFSMFYDLESPVDFCKQIRDVLDPKGMWVFEQSYMPLMLERNSFDTICHEHLEYYGLEQIIWIMAEAGLKVVDVELNDINGGSFSVTATLKSNPHPVSLDVSAMLKKEIDLKTSSLEPYEKFNAGIDRAKVELHDFLHTCEKQGHKVAALGASTKGNVLLQHLKLSSKEIVAVGEINVDKFGRITPGTNIPIVDEAELLSTDIEYFIVLPWHFRDYFVECGRYKGKKLVFPLPRLEIVQL